MIEKEIKKVIRLSKKIKTKKKEAIKDMGSKESKDWRIFDVIHSIK